MVLSFFHRFLSNMLIGQKLGQHFVLLKLQVSFLLWKAMQLPGRPSYFVRATDLHAASLLIVLNTVQAVERTMKRIFVTDIQKKN